jgi:putative endonuclease
MYYIYILFSPKLNRLYTGTTDNPERRLEEHNSKHYENAFTTKGVPWELILTYQCKSSDSAYKLEDFIKRMKSKKFIEKIISDQKIIVDIESKL